MRNKLLEREDTIEPFDMGFGENVNGLPIICNNILKSGIRKSAGVSEADYVSTAQEVQAQRQEYLNLFMGD